MGAWRLGKLEFRVRGWRIWAFSTIVSGKKALYAFIRYICTPFQQTDGIQRRRKNGRQPLPTAPFNQELPALRSPTQTLRLISPVGLALRVLCEIPL